MLLDFGAEEFEMVRVRIGSLVRVIRYGCMC